MNKIHMSKNKKILLAEVLVLILLLVLLAVFLNKKNILPNILNPKEKMESNVELTYKKTKVKDDGTECTVLLTIVADEGIEKIIEPDGEEITPIDGRTKLAIDYTLNFDEDYEFKITDKTGTETPKILRVPAMGEIYTIEDLEDINLWLYGNYKLMNNLDFKDRDSYATDEKYEYYNKDENEDGKPDNSWTPIGFDTDGFMGTFDGDYYCIKNLYINNNQGYQGLFSRGGKEYCNIYLKNVYINGKDYVGAICGFSQRCQYKNIKVTGRIRGNGEIGGIFGHNEYNPSNDEPTASRCCFIGQINSSGYSSGIGEGYYINNQDCYTLCTYTGSYVFAGIKCGDGGTEKRCYTILNGNSIIPICTATYRVYPNTESCFSECIGQIYGNHVYNNQQDTLRTEEQLKSKTTYTDAGWDFDTIWEMNDKTGYPSLQWEKNIKIVDEEEKIDLKITDGLVDYWPLQGNLDNYYVERVDLTGNPQFKADGVYMPKTVGISTKSKYTLNTEYTVALQIKNMKNDNSNEWYNIWSIGIPQNNMRENINGVLLNGTSAGITAFSSKNPGNCSVWTNYDNSVLNDGEWHQLVSTSDGETFSFYIDGELRGQNVEPIINEVRPLVIGFCTSGVSFPCSGAEGYYKNFAIFNRALSEEEINNLF